MYSLFVIALMDFFFKKGDWINSTTLYQTPSQQVVLLIVLLKWEKYAKENLFDFCLYIVYEMILWLVTFIRNNIVHFLVILGL